MMTARVLSLVATVAALGAGLLAGACTYTGKPADNPVERRFTYMSYLAADDLRAVCTAGTPERYRFVYNAEYSRQVRLYEVEIEPDGRGAVLEARILAARRSGRSNLASTIGSPSARPSERISPSAMCA